MGQVFGRYARRATTEHRLFFTYATLYWMKFDGGFLSFNKKHTHSYTGKNRFAVVPNKIILSIYSVICGLIRCSIKTFFVYF